MHHQIGADSFRLRLLLMEMMMSCLHSNEDCCRSTNGLLVSCVGKRLKYVSNAIDNAVTSGDDQDLGDTNKRILQSQWRSVLPAVMFLGRACRRVQISWRMLGGSE